MKTFGIILLRLLNAIFIAMTIIFTIEIIDGLYSDAIYSAFLIIFDFVLTKQLQFIAEIEAKWWQIWKS
jgi:hypothetical protein